MNYEEALRIAEAREREVRSFFDKFDVDGSGTIDMEEILAIMEEMGLLKNLKTDRITFCSEMFVKYDANDDGVLSFDEFKGFYNAAIDDARGRKRAPKPTLSRSKTSSGLSDETKNARKKLAEEKARKKAEEAERIRKENAEMKARIMAEKKKDDPPGKMDEQILQARKEASEKRKQKKDEEQKKLKAENRALSKKLSNVKAITDHDITDDDGGAIQALRDQKAKESEEAKAAHKAMLKDRQKTISDIKANAKALTDHDITDDDGGAIQAMRDKKAQEGIDKAASTKAMHKERQQTLKDMKANTVARTDHDLLDDVVDGVSVADARKQKAAESDEARQMEMKRANQSSKDLAAMKANTVARTDDGDGTQF